MAGELGRVVTIIVVFCFYVAVKMVRKKIKTDPELHVTKMMILVAFSIPEPQSIPNNVVISDQVIRFSLRDGNIHLHRPRHGQTLPRPPGPCG